MQTLAQLMTALLTKPSVGHHNRPTACSSSVLQATCSGADEELLMCSKRPRSALSAAMVESVRMKAGHEGLPLVVYNCGMRKHNRKQFLPQRSPAF